MIHQQTARAIETIYSHRLEDHYSELAHHAILGNDAERGIRYAQLAAEQALGRSAYEEASSMLDAALKLLEKLPDGAERLRPELALRNIESHLAFVRYGASSKQREVAINRLCEIGEKLGEPEQLVRGLVNLVNLLFPRGEASRGLEVATRCLELAKSTENTTSLTDAEWGYGLVAESCGNLAEALANYESARHRAERLEGGVSTLGFMFSSAILCHLAPLLMLLGEVDEAVGIGAEGLRRARESGHLFSLGHALIVAGGWLPRYRREPEVARVFAEEAIALSEEHGQAEWLPWGHFFRGWALAELGQLQEGTAEMEMGVAGFRQMGGVPRQQYGIACLARNYARVGRTEEAVTMLDGALAHVERSGEQIDLAEMLRLKGEVILTPDASATAEAERCFRAALEVARGQGARWWELRATTTLASLLRDTGRRDEARTMLAEIYNWFTQGFDTPDLKDAKALLEELTN